MALRGLFPIAESETVPADMGSRTVVRARATGEFRNPTAGEWFLSGAIVEAYHATCDLSTPYNIAELVPYRQAPETFKGRPVVGAIKLVDDPSELPGRWLIMTANHDGTYNTHRIAWHRDEWAGVGGRYDLSWERACASLGERAAGYPGRRHDGRSDDAPTVERQP